MTPGRNLVPRGIGGHRVWTYLVSNAAGKLFAFTVPVTDYDDRIGFAAELRCPVTIRIL
jgi:hypothetical protein